MRMVDFFWKKMERISGVLAGLGALWVLLCFGRTWRGLGFEALMNAKLENPAIALGSTAVAVLGLLTSVAIIFLQEHEPGKRPHLIRTFEAWYQRNYQPVFFYWKRGEEFLSAGWELSLRACCLVAEVWRSGAKFHFNDKSHRFDWEARIWRDKQGSYWLVAVDEAGVFRQIFPMCVWERAAKKLVEMGGGEVGTYIKAGNLLILSEGDRVFNLNQEILREIESLVIEIRSWLEYASSHRTQEWKLLQNGDKKSGVEGVAEVSSRLSSRWLWAMK